VILELVLCILNVSIQKSHLVSKVLK
ncbi:hypothetical protein A5836_000781, partial [Enterococcus faecium]